MASRPSGGEDSLHDGPVPVVWCRTPIRVPRRGLRSNHPLARNYTLCGETPSDIVARSKAVRGGESDGEGRRCGNFR